MSTYRSQVDRLTKDIADLRGKLGNKNTKLADDRRKAMRAAEAMSRASNASTARSKAREIERYEKSASDHEKRAARIERQIASKQKSLSSAKGNLETALEKQRKKEDREAGRRRKDELAHVREIERKRRTAQEWPELLRARPVGAPRPPASGQPTFDEHYDVCLSFAGEQRGYVELVARGLKDAGLDVFYDQDE